MDLLLTLWLFFPTVVLVHFDKLSISPPEVVLLHPLHHQPAPIITCSLTSTFPWDGDGVGLLGIGMEDIAE
jgi:hypothetical protein